MRTVSLFVATVDEALFSEFVKAAAEAHVGGLRFSVVSVETKEVLYTSNSEEGADRFAQAVYDVVNKCPFAALE